MKSKVTIYDVAKAAGVSAATVSYVINDKENQSISDETKQKVWHTINLLKYKPSVFAKNLRAAPHSKLIAICTQNSAELADLEYLSILKSLSDAFPHDYSLVFVNDSKKKLDNADAIIAYNVSKDYFYEIGNRNYIPLIAVNCVVNDALFFQITTDYSKLKALADTYFNDDYTFISINPSDISLKKEINNTFDSTLFVETYDELNQLNCNNILTSDFVLYDYLMRHNKNVLFIKDNYNSQFKQIVECIEKALSDEPFDKHIFKV